MLIPIEKARKRAQTFYYEYGRIPAIRETLWGRLNPFVLR